MLGVAAPAGPRATPDPPSEAGAPATLPSGASETRGFPRAPYDDRECVPTTPLVDPDATASARCLAGALDTWQAEGKFGVGQQINASSQSYADPIMLLEPERVAVVGFDLEEVEKGEQFEFAIPPLDGLLEQAAQGAILTASWHAPNPSSRADSFDRSFQDLGALLDENRQEARRFWADYDAKLELLRVLQTGRDGLFPPAAVVFRPLHEANGDWFWWGQTPDPTAYQALYAAMQQRAADRGIHNIVWAYAANAKTDDRILNPVSLLPERVDLVGIDTYQQITSDLGGAEQRGSEQIDLTGISELASRASRLAITEVGPHGSVDGDWDPGAIARSVRSASVRPVYAMLWFDDGDGADGYSGLKQLSSLRRGPAWLSTCADGVCSLL